MQTHTSTRHTPVGVRLGGGGVTHCESTLDIPRMREDCQIHPDAVAGSPPWDQARMRASCPGPKPGGWGVGFRPATGCQSEQAEGLETLQTASAGIKRTALPASSGRGGRERTSRERDSRPHITPQASGSGLLFGDKEQNNL